MSGKIKLEELEKFQNKFEGEDVRASGVLIVSIKYDGTFDLGVYGGQDEELATLLIGAVKIMNAVIHNASVEKKKKKKK